MNNKTNINYCSGCGAPTNVDSIIITIENEAIKTNCGYCGNYNNLNIKEIIIKRCIFDKLHYLDKWYVVNNKIPIVD